MVERTFWESVQIFGFLYLLSVAFFYYLSHKYQKPIIIPGDIYNTRQGRIFYIPTGGALVLSIILYYLIFSVLLKHL